MYRNKPIKSQSNAQGTHDKNTNTFQRLTQLRTLNSDRIQKYRHFSTIYSSSPKLRQAPAGRPPPPVNEQRKKSKLGCGRRSLPVVHEEKLKLLDVVDKELVEAVGHNVAGALVGPCRKSNDAERMNTDTGRREVRMLQN